MVARSAFSLVAVAEIVTSSGAFAQVARMRGPAVVTAQQLGHKVPGKARKEFDRATRAQDRGDYEKAIEHLKKAVAIDPEFTDAANNLGVAYLHTNHVDLAIDQFNKAIAIDPHGTLAYSNLTVALLMREQFMDAEQAARHQLEVERASTRPRFLLGLALIGQKKYTSEAEQNLRRAAVDFPEAHLHLARLFAAKGQIQPAKDQLTEYLASGDLTETAVANDWLRRLNSLPYANAGSH
jgi:Flp pilus assembly protein TadD